MSLALTVKPMPLVSDSDGMVRVGSSRVTLDTVVAAFREGMTAEGIVEQYPALRLAGVYSVIGYYLDHQEELDAFLRAQRLKADVVRAENESRFDPTGVRARLVARSQPG